MKQIEKNTKEENKLRKILMITLFMALSVVMMYGMADAISGVCSGCHTMHDSQDGAVVASSGPNSLLLLGSGCAGCHTSGGIVTAPLVDKTTNLLAGGTFNVTVADDDSKRHDLNATDYTGHAESAISTTPGNTGATIVVAPNALTCAGAAGCHGKHVAGMDSDAGIRGSHHNPAATYRFLWIGTTASPTAVLGIGEGDYEVAVSNTNHNVYSADGTQGISKFCDQCHAAFHGTGAAETGGSASPWKRHPTDYALFTGGAAWTSASTNLNANDAPIGLITIGGAVTEATNYYADGTIDETNSAVICLSCHRAHGSANPDLLRWDYSTMSAGGAGTTGCLSCHYLQR